MWGGEEVQRPPDSSTPGIYVSITSLALSRYQVPSYLPAALTRALLCRDRRTRQDEMTEGEGWALPRTLRPVGVPVIEAAPLPPWFIHACAVL